ncbi:MAG TPA: hypothetical protein VF598_04430 [Hymenobacter sp.]
MSSKTKIVARLRTEATDQLPRLLQLFKDPAEQKLIQQEIQRRESLSALPVLAQVK